MILVIDTSDHELVKVELKENGKVIGHLEERNRFGSQVLLGLVKRVLEENGADFKDLQGIEVAVGPGSFTGLRVGASVANALAYSLSIPVNGKMIEDDLKYT